MIQNINKKKFLKLGSIFVGATTSTLVLIMAITYICQRFDNGVPESGVIQNSETVKKNDDHTASMRYSGHITISLDEGLINLYFENPIRSRKSIILKIIGNIDGEDVTLAQTEKILPGEKIESIKYTTDKKLERGQYAGKFELRFYNENGGEEIVNSGIDIGITIE